MSEFTYAQRAAIQILKHAADYLMEAGRGIAPPQRSAARPRLELLSPGPILDEKRNEICMEAQ